MQFFRAVVITFHKLEQLITFHYKIHTELSKAVELYPGLLVASVYTLPLKQRD